MYVRPGARLTSGDMLPCMPSLSELADQLWRGETRTSDPQHHPFVALNRIEELAPGVAFYKGFSNIAAVKTDDGLVLIDTGSYHPTAHQRSFEKVRSYATDRLHTAIYTHGHVDHAYGLPPFLKEAAEKNWARPEILGHQGVIPRMRRYNETAGYNSVINSRQFNVKTEWPTNPIFPSRTFDDALNLTVGGEEIWIRHAKGETDDHAWVFLPRTRVLYTGDLFIWAAPNAGNPQKVQRYAIEWARGLREMAALAPEILLPGHGLPVIGRGNVAQALTDTADYLESLYTQTLAMLNAGVPVVDMIHEIAPPAHLAEKPYLLPIYDEPEFIVRNIHRCLGGWWSGVPSELKPAPRHAQAREIAALAGGPEKLIARAAELAEAGDMRLACHLADWAGDAAPESVEVHRIRAAIYTKRMETEPSTMSKGIFGAAARESAAKG
jgi:alkyl sulfatase BDS1-like metallo-beta-lactamase superfamily hydrolase